VPTFPYPLEPGFSMKIFATKNIVSCLPTIQPVTAVRVGGFASTGVNAPWNDVSNLDIAPRFPRSEPISQAVCVGSAATMFAAV